MMKKYTLLISTFIFLITAISGYLAFKNEDASQEIEQQYVKAQVPVVTAKSESSPLLITSGKKQAPPFETTEDTDYLISQEQQLLFDDIHATLLNPSVLQSFTAEEIMERMEGLTPAQQSKLMSIAYTMINSGELKIDHFKKPEPKRHLTVTEGAPLPSIEDQAVYNEISNKFLDTQYLETLTFVSLAIELEKLPPSLKQEVSDQINEMMRTGLIDPGKFLGPNYAGSKDATVFFN